MLIADVDTRGARPANESEADESESMTDFFLWRLSGVWDAMLSRKCTRQQPRLMPLPANVLVSARWSSAPPDRVRAGGGVRAPP